MPSFGPISSLPVSALPTWRAAVAMQTIVAAAEATAVTLYTASIPFITQDSDTPANTPFDGTLLGSLVVSRAISSGSDGYSGYAQNISELTLINSDGGYDDVADDYSINGQNIVTKIGTADGGEIGAYAQFETIALNIGERWLPSRDSLRVESTDFSSKLDVPAQNAYQGIGGLEGGEEIKGQRKPRGFGGAYNATPVLVVAAEGLFQCHDGAVATIGAVKDGGIPLNFFADYATSALLRAALVTGTTIPPGSYGTCIAEGFFGIGGVAFKQVTVDFTLAAQTTADIIEALVLDATELTAADLDAFTFDDLNTAQPAVREYFLGADSSKTVAEVMNDLMRGIGGFWYLTTLGKLRLQRMEAPGMIASEYYDLEGGNLIEIDRAPLPGSVDPPPRRRRVTWAHNWTQQTDLYGQVSEGDPALAAYLATPYKLATTSDESAALILADYPFAPDPEPVLGYFRDEADAQDEADRLLALYSSGYKAFRFKAKNALFIHQVGEVVNIKDSTTIPRLGLGTDRYVRLVEVNDDTRDFSTEMIGFG